MAKHPELVKIVGPAGWCRLSDNYRGRIVRGILRGGNEVVMDVDYGGLVYNVKLQRASGDRFEGHWTQAGPNAVTGVASAVVYTSSVGRLLFGAWVERETRYHWWAEMSEVDHFPDESSR